MPRPQVRRAQRQLLRSGPYQGVRNTPNAFIGTPEFLVDAENLYIVDPSSPNPFLARPGYALQNSTSALAAPGQAIHTHIALDGSVYNFAISGGKLYRADSALSVFTDVTPTSGVTISSTVRRGYFLSFADNLIISDGVNKPWLATNLSAAHVTGTAIDYDGAGTTWSAFGQPVAYAGSVIFILNQVNSVFRRSDIAWSAPGTPAIGYEQTDYDYNWTLEQTGTTPITALWGTNEALVYWRDQSVNYLTGVPGPDFQGASTHANVSQNIGTLQSATIAQWSDTIFFCDQFGRPWMFQVGNSLIPIWENLESVIESSTSGYPGTTQQVACAVILPSLNIYLAAIWSPVGGIMQAPTEFQAFDCKTGNYEGRWYILTGTSIEACGTWNDTSGRGSLVVIGSQDPTPNSPGGFVWTQNGSVTGGIPVVTNADMFLVTNDGRQLTTNNVVPSFLDNGTTPILRATTHQMGYSAESTWNADQGVLITGSPSPVQVTGASPSVSGMVEGTPTPLASQDGIYRLPIGLDLQGRGLTLIVQATDATEQWSLQELSVFAVPSLAGPDDI